MFFSNHEHGVYVFDWSTEGRVMASAGVERDILLWNPYSKRTIGVLECGLGSISDLLIDDRRQQLICVDVTNTIRVFDLRTHKLVQIFQQDTKHNDVGEDGGEMQPSNDTNVAFETNFRLNNLFLYYDQNFENSLITSTTQLYKWPSQVIQKGTSDSVATQQTEKKIYIIFNLQSSISSIS
jgi:WD40 repeat protein